MTGRSLATHAFVSLRYVAVVVTASLLLLEFYLQLAAWVVADRRGSMPLVGAGETQLVLCIGDSNTYGIYLPEDASYPSQLKRLWATHDGGSVEVVNLGYPGINSSRALSTYREVLNRMHPDIALIMVGVNDPWTQPLEGVRSEQGANSLLASIQSKSRLYRFYLIQVAGRFDPAKLHRTKVPGVDFRSSETSEAIREAGGMVEWLERSDLGEGIDAPISYDDSEFSTGFQIRRHAPSDPAAVIDSLRANLEDLISLSQRSSVDLYIMTYPTTQDFYGPINAIIRETVQRNGAQLVDLERYFSERCPDTTACNDLFFPDGHPTEKGYKQVADELDRRVRLRRAGG